MIDYNYYINEVSDGSLETLGVYGSLASKLISDLDSGLYTTDECEEFMRIFEANEGIDLVDFM